MTSPPRSASPSCSPKAKVSSGVELTVPRALLIEEVESLGKSLGRIRCSEDPFAEFLFSDVSSESGKVDCGDDGREDVDLALHGLPDKTCNYSGHRVPVTRLAET